MLGQVVAAAALCATSILGVARFVGGSAEVGQTFRARGATGFDDFDSIWSFSILIVLASKWIDSCL